MAEKAGVEMQALKHFIAAGTLKFSAQGFKKNPYVKIVNKWKNGQK